MGKKKKKLKKIISKIISENDFSYPPVVVVKGFRYTNDGKDNQKE